MISRLHNNNSFRSVDELSSEQESVKTTQAESAQQASAATATNIKEPTSIEFPNLKAEEKKP